jgi:hypothetical protein
VDEIGAALSGNWREEHIFALRQALELYDTYHSKITECDARVETVLGRLRNAASPSAHQPLPPARHRDATANAPTFDARAALHAVLGVDLTQIHGLGASLALKLVGECGTDLSAWPDAKHFTSWLCLAPGNKISGGKVLSTRTRRSGSRAAALLRLAAVTVGRTQTALGAFYRRLAARIGKAKAVTATARKIAVLFYNTLRHGMAYADPGASYYEEKYRVRVLTNLKRRAKSLGYVLQQETSTTCLPGRLDEIAREKGVDPGAIEIWFADEARVGQKNKITRRWAKRGTRPSAPKDQRTASAYIFGAICPKDGKGAALVLPRCDTEAMNLHRAEIATQIAPGAHAALFVDQAGWHLSGRLIVPPNITLIALPAKCPELNPQENIWQFMRDNWLSNRIFKSFDDIVDHCCDAWNKLVDQPCRIMSIGIRDWAYRS